MSKKLKISRVPFADMIRFLTVQGRRKKAIRKAGKEPFSPNEGMIPGVYELHPMVQHVRIDRIEEEGADTKSYYLKPKEGKLAYFQAGQYVSVSVKIKDTYTTRPYSLSSSPKDALNGFYRISVKKTSGGFVSDYILTNWAVGQEVLLSGPDGHFSYNYLRDRKTIVGLAGGSGITPFLSMAKAIAEGTLNASLILLYGSRNESSILFKDELEELEKSSDRIQVIHVLSEEDKEGCEKGFITPDLVRKYAPESYSVFVCGPQAMYRYLKKELPSLGLPEGKIRYEMMNTRADLKSMSSYPSELLGKTYQLTVHQCGEVRTITVSYEDSILISLEKNGFHAPSRCRSGECGFCHSRCIQGSLFLPEELDYLRRGDKDFGYFHPCVTYALSNLEIEIPGVPEEKK